MAAIRSPVTDGAALSKGHDMQDTKDVELRQDFPTKLLSGRIVGPGPVAEIEREISREREEWMRNRADL